MADLVVPVPPPNHWTREQLVTLLQGSRILIPDLRDLMSHWPSDVHPDIEKLEQDVERTLES